MALITTFLFVPSASFAKSLAGVVPGSRYTSARGAALGEAYLPLADDGVSALFYNPAALGKLRGTHFEPLNLSLQGNSTLFNQFGLTTVGVTSLSSYRSTLKKNPGDLVASGMQVAPVFFTKGFAFGMLFRTDLGGQYRSATDEIRNVSRYLLVPTAGYGFKLASGIFRAGYSVQYVNQASGDSTSADTSSVGYTRGLKEGAGLSHTLGATLTFPYEFLPQINVVARNLFGTKYSSGVLLPMASGASGRPDTDPMTLDASFSIHPKGGNGTNFHIVTQIRDALGATGSPIFSRLSLGTEFDFRNTFFLRLGFGSGYPSAGIGFRRKQADLHFAFYSVEMDNAFRSTAQTFWIFQYQLRVF